MNKDSYFTLHAIRSTYCPYIVQMLISCVVCLWYSHFIMKVQLCLGANYIAPKATVIIIVTVLHPFNTQCVIAIRIIDLIR